MSFAAHVPSIKFLSDVDQKTKDCLVDAAKHIQPVELDGIYALANQIYGTLPFLFLFQIGFLYTGLLSIVQQYARFKQSRIRSAVLRKASTIWWRQLLP